ncbi:hypothetical protein [Anabaena sp. UHCC 0399]|uniref:hypothetical protein n=1 Tax=Anabaena sp. UHCC 0399 TaxID=3110238 RepID=UPI002B1F35EE|nr:hypothetical protein [Anabaena sp. UHCC 0399]MEA5567501.1 hypothetical protein [Anabaena sp. UHCC 0399]
MDSLYFGKEIKISELSLTHEQMILIIEYLYLARLNSLSEQQTQRISDILEIAQQDPKIDFWLTEADQFIGQQLNLINEYEYKNLQAKLREYLVTDCNNLSQTTSRKLK